MEEQNERKIYAKIEVYHDMSEKIVRHALESADFWVSPRKEGLSKVYYGEGAEFKVGSPYGRDVLEVVLSAEDDQSAIQAYEMVMRGGVEIHKDRIGIHCRLHSVLMGHRSKVTERDEK